MTIDLSDITVISVVAVDVPTDEVIYQIAQPSPLAQFAVGTGGLGSANKIGSRYRYSGSDYTAGEDALDGQILLFNRCNSSAGENNMHLDGTAATQTYDARSGGTISLIIGDRGDLGKDFTGNIQELIYYEIDQSDNRTAIETDINTYFSIY